MHKHIFSSNCSEFSGAYAEICGRGRRRSLFANLRDNLGENLLLQINIFRAISGDFFVTTISVKAENDILHSPQKNVKSYFFADGGTHRSPPPYVTVTCKYVACIVS